jgi:aminopeptidase N
MKTPETIYLKDYTPANHIVEKVDLTFDLHEEKTIVTSVMQIHKNKETADKTTPLIFDLSGLEILSVIANGMVLLPHEYDTGEDGFKLNSTPDQFELEIKCQIHPEKNTSLEGLYKSGDIFCTQCEAQGFRKITPFPDRPDVMSIYSCTIIADKAKYPVLLSNGNLIDKGDLENNRHYVRWEDPYKKPSYLFALVAGDLAHIHDTYKTMSGRVVDLKIYSEQTNIDQCSHAMRSLKQSMKWDEDRFGLEYDLDLYQIVAINDFNAGAMENKGLNIFNSKYVIADPKTATDQDFLNVQGVIGHEYFHNWTGNRVTLKNWFQLSLKEGLTVFRDQEFSSDLNSRGVKRISSVRNLRAFQFPEDSGPMTHPVMPPSYIKMDNFYTSTVYQKGAELVRMIHQLLGEEKFQKGMVLYFEKYDGMAVTIDEFTGVMEEASGISLAQFKNWYTQSGTPEVSMTRDYDPDLKILKLTFEQQTAPDRNQSEKKPQHIPVRFSIVDENGRDITPPGHDLLELKSRKEVFTFEDIPPNCLPSVFRQFSAPVKLTTDLNDDETAFLMANDYDDFNRWDAAQTLFIKEIKSLVKTVQSKETLKVSDTLMSAFKTALQKFRETDRAFLAEMLTLPMETEIKDHFDRVDVDAIHTARHYLKKALAEAYQDEFMKCLEYCSKADPNDISNRAMADRSLKNLCLSYIGSLRSHESNQVITNQFNTAGNMTDELAAFTILCDIDSGKKQQASDQFYEKWQADKLVLDKWFSVQASSELSDTLACVKQLTHHADFSLTNPNKVRALIFMFAMYNQVHFHAQDGSGYRFVSDHVITLDSINPQVAARLATSFNHWKRYDDHRKALMKSEIERIGKVEKLSKNTYEIVSRALE